MPEIALYPVEKLTVTIQGFLSSRAVAEQEILVLAERCLSTLYPALKGIVASMTGLLPGGPVVVPHVDTEKILVEKAVELLKRD